MELTLHEIRWRLKAMLARINEGRKFEMAINGINPGPSGDGEAELAENKLTDDQKRAMDIALKRAQERKAQEYKARMNNGR